MTSHSFTTTITLDRPAAEVFEAITDPCAWWSTSIEGRPDHVGAQFAFDSPGHHLWKFTVTELVPGRKVVWQVFDSTTNFVDDLTEWDNTEVRFELSETEGTTHLTFTHAGLTPRLECFDACSAGWTGYITDSLPNLVTTGTGRPGRY
jgi:uncharacterized protein YndB with AHSA1/START domain